MPRLSKKARFYDNLFEKTHNIEDWISCFSICVWEKLQFYYEQESYESKAGEINQASAPHSPKNPNASSFQF